MKDSTRNIWRPLPKPRFLPQLVVQLRQMCMLPPEVSQPQSLPALSPRCSFFSCHISLTGICSLELCESSQSSDLCDPGSLLERRYFHLEGKSQVAERTERVELKPVKERKSEAEYHT